MELLLVVVFMSALQMLVDAGEKSSYEVDERGDDIIFNCNASKMFIRNIFGWQPTTYLKWHRDSMHLKMPVG